MTDTARDHVNIRAPRYWLAHTLATCNRCRGTTPLFALALPPGHETLQPDDDESAAAVWERADHSAFLFHIEHLAPGVRARLEPLAAGYRRDPGADTGAQWSNHCARCGFQFDDHDLFCEPEGAFLPISEAAAARIHLELIDEGFEAGAAGYAHEPEFFAALGRDAAPGRD